MEDTSIFIHAFTLKVNEQTVCVKDRLGVSGSVLSTTCVSVNRTAELQKGAKVCPVSDL